MSFNDLKNFPKISHSHCVGMSCLSFMFGLLPSAFCMTFPHCSQEPGRVCPHWSLTAPRLAALPVECSPASGSITLAQQRRRPLASGYQLSAPGPLAFSWKSRKIPKFSPLPVTPTAFWPPSLPEPTPYIAASRTFPRAWRQRIFPCPSLRP